MKTNLSILAHVLLASVLLGFFTSSARAQNTATGANALIHTTGANNTADGANALENDTTGSLNSATGFDSLFKNVNTQYNVADGGYALYSNHATANVAVGAYSLFNNATGNYNLGLGYSALFLNTTGSNNAATGAFALYSNTTGYFNVANGVDALYFNTSGYDNTASGYMALYGNSTGFENTANGALALYSNQTGYFNIANGFSALYSNTTGSINIATGVFALYANTNGVYNTAYGYTALYQNTTGSDNVADGTGALSEVTTGGNNIGIGFVAGEELTTGSNNIDIGNEGVSSDNGIIRIGDGVTQTATYLTGVIHGNGAGITGIAGLSTAGTENIAAGISALSSNTSGQLDSATGFGALEGNTTGNSNVANGALAMGGGTVTGYDDIAVGVYSLYSLTSGYYNVALGHLALYDNSTGIENVAVGDSSLNAIAAGIQNTAVGYDALGNLSSGYSDTALGPLAGASLVTGDNDIYLGAPASSSSENNVMRLGSSQITNTYIAGSTIGINLNSPTAGTLDFNGGYIIAEGYSGVRPYIGDNGSGNDVQIGSFKSGITSVACYNQTDQNYMHLYCSSLTLEGGGININAPTQGTLDFNGGYILAEGLSGVRPYIGDDGSGNDVQIGSFKSGITSVACFNETDGTYMHLYCSAITIEGGSDLAEPFRISKAKQPIVEGDVVVIDEANPGQLTLTSQPYDTRVAGVVSGANGIHPGIQMQQQGLLDGGRNVALTGRVYVQADTSNGPIHPGDLLTTSSNPGRAMKVTDHPRAQGSILGKAMTSLDAGQGMVLVLVTLQ